MGVSIRVGVCVAFACLCVVCACVSSGYSHWVSQHAPHEWCICPYVYVSTIRDVRWHDTPARRILTCSLGTAMLMFALDVSTVSAR